jgi:osmoprotectant transport system ATP-binding protein
MHALLRDLCRRHRPAVLLVTHDVDEAIVLGSRIAVMQTPGHIAQLATPGELLAAPATDFIRDFIGRRDVMHDESGRPIGYRVETPFSE